MVFYQEPQQNNKPYLVGGLLLLGATFCLGYCSGGTKQKTIVQRVEEPLKTRNLRLLTNFTRTTNLDELNLEYDSTSYEGIEAFVRRWNSLDSNGKVRLVRDSLKDKSEDLLYKARDFTEDNIHDVIMFFFGGG